jgi:hypothetical protein
VATTARRIELPIERLDVTAYTVPTEQPQSDGTLEWDSTTIVIVEVAAGGERGLGYTYVDATAAQLTDRRLITRGSDGPQAAAACSPRSDCY